MKRPLLHGLCLLLAFSLLLTGCGKEDSGTDRVHSEDQPGGFGFWGSNDTPSESKKPQDPISPTAMSQNELDWAVDHLEYSGIAAILELSNQTHALQRSPSFYPDETVYIGDVDGDSLPEIVFGSTLGMMDRGNNREYVHEFAQSGFGYYVDKNGVFYRNSGIGADSWSFDWDDPGMPGPDWNPPLPESGNPADWTCFDEYYDTFYPGNAHSFSYAGEYIYEILSYGEDFRVAEKPYYEKYVLSTQDGAVYENEEAAAYLEGLELRSVQTKAGDYTVTDYDRAYAQSLLEAMHARFSSDYSGYQGSLQADVDGDGETEILFVISNYLEPWRYNVHDPYRDYPVELDYTTLDVRRDYTVVLIADQEGSKLQFRALAASGLHGHGDILLRGNYLQIGSGIYLLAGNGSSGANSESCQLLSQYLAQFGYTDSYFLLADLCDEPGQEVVSYCYKDGSWYILVIVIRQGIPVVLDARDTTDKAYYIIDQGGKTYLMSYDQGINSWNNTPYYSYQVYRYGADGSQDWLDSRQVSVKADGSNAYETAQFQQSFHGLLVKVIVVYDPFSITGSQKPDPGQVAFGDIPQEAQTQVGYVQLNDPSTWLHLREGPGIQYPRVLIDPSDPDSFIRQAQGSAVTILESIETGDAQNPVWVKIRIQYAGREIIGYSSRTYIRIPGE